MFDIKDTGQSIVQFSRIFSDPLEIDTAKTMLRKIFINPYDIDFQSLVPIKLPLPLMQGQHFYYLTKEYQYIHVSIQVEDEHLFLECTIDRQRQIMEYHLNQTIEIENSLPEIHSLLFSINPLSNRMTSHHLSYSGRYSILNSFSITGFSQEYDN
ncbi:MAG: hypothetical protein ACRC6X_01890 [Culicoidibacterales bacterium]